MKELHMPARFLFLSLALLAGLQSCVKDTMDLDTLSRQGELNPKVALKVAKGTLNLGNAFNPNDTVVFNDDNSILLRLKQDTLISFDVNELVEIPETLPESGPETKVFDIGVLLLDDFSTTRSISLQELSENLPEPYKSNIPTLEGNNPFPPIDPPVNAGSYASTAFGNYSMVTFGSGTVSLTITNNLPVVLDPVTVRLVDAGSNEIGTMTFNNIPANGGTQTRESDLTGLTMIDNQFTAEITALGTPGSATPVDISMSDQIILDIHAFDVTISSGTAILPDQAFDQDSSSIDFEMTGGEEIYFIKLKGAQINYTITSNIQEDIRVNIILPSATVDGNPAVYQEIIPYNSGNPTDGVINLHNVLVDLTTDPIQPYNIFPFKYVLDIVSSNNLVTFDFTNDLSMEFTINNVQFSYVEGYLGKIVESFEADTISIEDEVLDKISGTFELADPRVKFFYTNSFGIPIELAIDATGYFTAGNPVDLGVAPQTISYPADTFNLFVTDTLSFDKSNSELEKLLVFPPPMEVIYSGSVTVNPAEDKNIPNFVTDRSRIDVGLEVEIPLAFKANNLSLADTLEIEVSDGFSWDNINYSKIYIGVEENWFPFDLKFEITPYDSATSTTGAPMVVTLIAAANVNAEGVVEQYNSYTEIIDLDSQFFGELTASDRLIVKVTLTTSGGGSQNVVLKTNYRLVFNIGLLTEFNYPFEF